MPTVTWARLDGERRRAVLGAAEEEFAAHGFSGGSLNVVAKRAGVAKGSLFQYFADKRDLYAYVTDQASQRVRAYMEAQIHALDSSRPFFDFLTDLLDAWVAYFADNPRQRACMPQPASRWTPTRGSACARWCTATTSTCFDHWCAMHRPAAICGATPTSTCCCLCC